MLADGVRLPDIDLYAERSRRHDRGFSIIELLISIGVIAVLLAITLPALRSSRTQAESITRLAMQQQCMTAIMMYTKDYGGYFPFIGETGKGQKFMSYRGWRTDWPNAHFKIDSVNWPSVVVPRYIELVDGAFHAFAGDPGADWFIYDGPSPPSVGNPFVSTNFRLSHTTSARPEYWRGEDHPEDLELLRGTRLDEVRFPSNKGILLDWISGRFGRPPEPDRKDLISVAMGDGSASFRAPQPLHAESWGMIRTGLGATSWPIMTTYDGVYGRDF